MYTMPVHTAVSRSSRGIANRGSTCYLGATVQALGHAPAFVTKLLRAPAHLLPHSRIVAALRRLVTAMWVRPGGTGGGNAIDPSQLLDALEPRFARLGAGSARDQSDAHELCTLLFDELVELSPALRALLEGQLQQAVRCEACGAVTTRLEPFTSLSLQMPPPTARPALQSLGDLLNAYMAPERIHGFRCDACDRTTTAARMASVWRAPEVLVLSLKRFEPTNDFAVSRAEVRPNESLACHTEGVAESGDVRYRLTSVVCHTGSQRSGHYVACARRPGSGTWDLHDDDAVVEVGGADDACPRAAWRSGYIYVYSLC